MRPNNENNFLIEVTPEVADELNQWFKDSDDEAYILHFSPYWKFAQSGDKKDKEGGNGGIKEQTNE